MTRSDRQRDTRPISISEYAIRARTESIDLALSYSPDTRTYHRISRAVVLTGGSR